MIEFRRILCPVDFSDFSRRALSHAVAMARRHEGRVTLLHVVPELPSIITFPLSVDPPLMDSGAREGLCEELREFAGAAREQAPMDVVVLEGDPARQIVDQARERGADLVVMGTHGRSGFERLALGSVTEKVLRKAQCPVLTVPRGAGAIEAAEPRFRRILCAVDFAPRSLHAVKQALSLAEASKAQLTLLHVLEWFPEKETAERRPLDVAGFRAHMEADARRRLEALVPEDACNWCEPREVVVFGKAWQEVLRRSAEDESDLIVMGVDGRSALEIMLLGSTTHHVVREAACPVLTIRPR